VDFIDEKGSAYYLRDEENHVWKHILGPLVLRSAHLGKPVARIAEARDEPHPGAKPARALSSKPYGTAPITSEMRRSLTHSRAMSYLSQTNTRGEIAI